MSIFTAISSLYKEPDSTGDDNSAVAAAENNPFVEASVLGARNAYGAMHAVVAPLIKGNEAALRNIDRQLKNWESRLQKVVTMYEELLKKLNDIGGDITGAMTLDLAKDAWEIVQDTPILRRYMGEANYWYLHDTVGLLATQSGSISADMLVGIKEYLKAAILALLSMTDGLLCLETYLGMIQQWWGSLYLKNVKMPLLDSIVPNVTTAYWYKPAIPSVARDGRTTLSNNPPGNGFTPIPVPIPDPVMAVRNPNYIMGFDPLNPATWYLNGTPYYLTNTMTMLYRALNYWTSSYTNARLPAVNDIYPRAGYADGEHPLVVGQTFAQIDESKTILDGSNMGQDASFADIREILQSVITDDMLADITEWQNNYILARQAYITRARAIAKNLNTEFNSISDLYSGNYQPSLSDAVRPYTNNMVRSIANMAKKAGKTQEEFFDAVMSAFVDAGHITVGETGSLKNSQVYAVAPSYMPNRMRGVNDAFRRSMGIPFLAYAIDTKDNVIIDTSSHGAAVTDGDVSNVVYGQASFSFVMFPSDDSLDMSYAATMPSYKADSVSASVVNVPVGTEVHTTAVSSGEVLSYVFQEGMKDSTQVNLGELPSALSKHTACGAVVGTNSVLGTMLFPDGVIPTIEDEASTRPLTFSSLYTLLMETGTTVSEELGDIIGYSVNKGREIKFPCFGVYGNLLSMQSWHYREMATSTFNASYAKMASGSDLYYAVDDPSHVVYRHSSYYSSTRQMDITIYHEALEHESKSYGSRDSYEFYVYPGESVSVSRIPDGINLGNLLSVDAVGPDGSKWHYVIMRNPIPKCAKYVDAKKWSIMDLVHEMYLLAYNLADLTADNGATLRQLDEDMAAFNVSRPEFIGQLPANNGQYVTYKFGIFQDYADRIEKLVNSVYDFRAKIITVTENW